MLIVGDPELWKTMIGLALLLIVYWVAKWIVSLWTGA